MRFDVVRLPLVADFVILLAFAVGAMVWFGGTPVSGGMGAPVPSLLGGYLQSWQESFPVIGKVVGVFLLFFAGIRLGRMSIRYGLYGVHTGLAIPIFGFLACGLSAMALSLPIALAVALFVLSLVTYCTCFRNGIYGFGALFRGSIYLGFIPLIYTPALVLVLIVPLVAIAFRRSGRELLVSGVGLLLPFLALSYVYWGSGNALLAPAFALWEFFCSPTGFSLFSLPLWDLVLAGVLLLLCLAAVGCYSPKSYSSGSRARSILLLLLPLLPLTASMLFLPCASIASVVLIAVPASILLPLFFVRISPAAALLLMLLPILLWGVVVVC